MKKIVLVMVALLILISVVAALGLGAYFLFIKDSGEDSSDTEASQNSEQNDRDDLDSDDTQLSQDLDDENTDSNASEFDSVADVFSKKDSLSCTWSYDDDDYAVNGVMYVADDKLFQEFVTDGEKSSILYINNEMYFWSDTTSEGIKLSTLEDGIAQDIDDALKTLSLYSGLGLTNSEYDCDSWKEDSSKFEVPSNINFLDLSDLGSLVDSYL